MTNAPVTITYQLRKQLITITKAEYDLLSGNSNQDAAATFIRQQYMLTSDAAVSVVEAVKAKTVTHLFDRRVEVRYSGEEVTQ